MTIFYLRSCDRAGRILHDRRVDAGDVHAALAHANRSFHRMARRSDAGLIDPAGRIDVADGQGNVVARLICAEALAGMLPATAHAAPRMTITA